MRKIISKEKEEKRRRRNQLVVGAILILVMVASIVGYAFGRGQKESNEKIIYNGFEFTKKSGFWNVNIGNYVFSFLYNPKEVQKMSFSLNSINNYLNRPLYIYSENSEAATEIYRNLFYQNKVVERVQNACPVGEKCEDNSPVKTCEDNFIIIKNSNSSEIKQQDSCVFIEGDANLVQLSDEFLFKIIGITQ